MMFVVGNAKARRRWRRRGLPNRQRMDAWERERETAGKIFGGESSAVRIVLTRPVYSFTLNRVAT